MLRCKLNYRRIKTALAAGTLAVAVTQADACGPWFPSTLLDRGDDAVLVAPRASFRGELERMRLVPPAFHAVPATNTYAEQTFGAEVGDLRAALLRAKVDEAQIGETVSQYTLERAKLRDFAKATEDGNNSDGEPKRTLDQWPAITTGLPPEFVRYFTGSVAWHSGLTNAARADWENLLRLPAEQRHFRSTWAAYMLGRAWHDEDMDKATSYYQQVRALAKAGFADRLGLAAASLGWEAQLLWRQKHHQEAIELYLDQLATGDDTAVNSLRFAAGQVSKLGTPVMQSLAANSRTRRVVTAFVISTRGFEFPSASAEELDADSDQRRGSFATRWLDAVEAADVRDVESAELFALAAYQSGRWDVAQRWINRARSTPTVQWLEVKLLLRAGQVDQAAALLSGLTRLFPLEPRDTNSPVSPALADSLAIDYYADSKTAAQQVWGEFGTFCLARREYTEALDALLRADFWMDAAYVAERVLTVDELRSYVDRNWPASVGKKAAGLEEAASSREGDPEVNIRYLLARRLSRLERYAEARNYYPPEWKAGLDELCALLQKGADESLPAMDRALALFAAARITRINGLELIGTEVEPDWHVHRGDYQEGVTVASRRGEALTNLPQVNEEELPDGGERVPGRVVQANQLHASEEELVRATTHTVTPDIRWHYRDQAALLGLRAAQLCPDNFQKMSEIIITSKAWLQDAAVAEKFYREVAVLGWQAAKGMPDNSDETARVLCQAGAWIKYWSPKEADVFYKALVRRCGKTAIGKQADRMRWFPRLDANGNLIPWHPDTPTEVPLLEPPPAPDSLDKSVLAVPETVPAPTLDTTGFCYVLHRGNSLQDVADAVRTDHGIEVSVDEILAANPGVTPSKLKPGLKIFLPLPIGPTESPEVLMDRLLPSVEPPTPEPPPAGRP